MQKKKFFKTGTGFARNSEVKLESRQSENERPHICKEEGCRFAVQAASMLILMCGGCRSCGRQIFGHLGLQQLQQFPVNSSCLLNILVLKKVRYTNTQSCETSAISPYRSSFLQSHKKKSSGREKKGSKGSYLLSSADCLSHPPPPPPSQGIPNGREYRPAAGKSGFLFP